ncbi:hypothetical protein QFC20_001791 [Naganishia adeliensis]|uniref:Uncharacterized protein n=1 Tax=Naganishia adeliensis TaxID=92952 RepID=A0ACC2WR50_9TREE|nr:hypothetical protein QFC20_001791 [Naganishia adeliensis]
MPSSVISHRTPDPNITTCDHPPTNVPSNKIGSVPHHFDQHHQDAQTVGRAFGFRMVKTIRRGQLPFLLVFFGCVTIFFGALCGIGYSEGADAVTGSGSSIHKHSFGTSDQPQRFTPELEDKLREMKKLENEWAAKRRTANDGAWMKANRDQKAIRRKPLANTPQEKMLMEQEREADALKEGSPLVRDAAVPQVDKVDVEAESLE